MATAYKRSSLSTAVAEQFPAGVRSTGLSLAYNLAVMLFGGFAQFFVTLMIDYSGDPLAAAYYVAKKRGYATRGAFPGWAATPVKDRARLVRKLG